MTTDATQVTQVDHALLRALDVPASADNLLIAAFHRQVAEAEAGAREAAHKAKIAELENEIDGLRFLASVIKDPDQRLCCDGRECGCMGSTVGQYAAWALAPEGYSAALTSDGGEA